MGLVTLDTPRLAVPGLYLPNNDTEDRIYYYKEGTERVALVEGVSTADGSVSKGTDSLNLIATRNAVAATRTYVTNILVDLTKIKTLYADWTNTGNANGNNISYLIVSTEKSGGVGTYNARVYQDNIFSRTIKSLDVSALSGLYYIRIHVRADGADGNTSNLTVYRIWGVT